MTETFSRVLVCQANLPYVLWTAAFNTTFILGYLVVQLTFPVPPSTITPTAVPSAGNSGSKIPGPIPPITQPGLHPASQPAPAHTHASRRSSVPPLLEAANKNALVIFLVVRPTLNSLSPVQ